MFLCGLIVELKLDIGVGRLIKCCVCWSVLCLSSDWG